MIRLDSRLITQGNSRQRAMQSKKSSVRGAAIIETTLPRLIHWSIRRHTPCRSYFFAALLAKMATSRIIKVFGFPGIDLETLIDLNPESHTSLSCSRHKPPITLTGVFHESESSSQRPETLERSDTSRSLVGGCLGAIIRRCYCTRLAFASGAERSSASHLTCCLIERSGWGAVNPY